MTHRPYGYALFTEASGSGVRVSWILLPVKGGQDAQDLFCVVNDQRHMTVASVEARLIEIVI
jgi:hypothetical protein